MRDRILIGLVALTLSLGLAVFAVPSRASDDSSPQDATVPVVEEPAEPSIPEIRVSEEGLEIGPLTPVAEPFPRFRATGVTADRHGSGVTATPPVDAPAAPISGADRGVGEALEVPALRPVAFRSPRWEESRSG